MDFSFTPEQEAYRATIRDFVRRHCPPGLDRQLELEARYPHELVPKLAETGVFGVYFPEEYGGIGGDAIDFCLTVEELAYGSEAASACYLLPVFFAGHMIKMNGSEDQKRTYLPRIIRGDLKGCFALTEPEAGSDAAAVKTTAEPDGDDFILKGHKHYISGADVADYIMTVTRTNKADRYNGITIFMVDRTLPGVSLRKMPKMGSKVISLQEIFFDNVRVPASMIMGGRECLNQGWWQMIKSLDMERLMVAISHVAIAQKAFDLALEHAKTRRQFGRTIGSFQAVQMQVADMAIGIEAGRQMTYHAAWLHAQGKPCSLEGAMAKVFCTEMCLKTCELGMQVLGGQSYLEDNDMNRWIRMALLGPVGMGSNNIQRSIISSMLGLQMRDLR
ncbi:MAG: acyl-CoA dehydrogenase family protein [Candidatus Binatia bacterium]